MPLSSIAADSQISRDETGLIIEYNVVLDC